MGRGVASLVVVSVGLVVAAVAVASVAACAAFDASASPADAAAPVDAPVTDAADAAADGPLFIDDFERNELLGPWSKASAMNGGDGIAVDGTLHATGARALHATVSGRQGIAYLERSGPLPNIQRVELSVRYDMAPNVGVIIAQVAYDNDTEINVALANGGIKASEQKMSDANHFFQSQGTPLPAGEWIRLVWTIDYTTNSVTIDSPGRTPPIHIDYTLSKTDLGKSVAALRTGIVYSPLQTTGPTNIWLDDIATY